MKQSKYLFFCYMFTFALCLTGVVYCFRTPEPVTLHEQLVADFEKKLSLDFDQVEWEILRYSQESDRPSLDLREAQNKMVFFSILDRITIIPKDYKGNMPNYRFDEIMAYGKQKVVSDNGITWHAPVRVTIFPTEGDTHVIVSYLFDPSYKRSLHGEVVYKLVK